MKQLNFDEILDEKVERKLKNISKKPSKKNSTKIYTDAGFAWKSNVGNKTKNGRVAWKIGRGKFHIKIVEIPEIKGLIQYGNLYELIAIMIAIEKTQAKNVLIITDSKVAMGWVKRRHNNLGQFSEEHYNTKERIEKAKKKFDNFNIEWTARDNNIVGVWLEKKFK